MHTAPTLFQLCSQNPREPRSEVETDGETHETCRCIGGFGVSVVLNLITAPGSTGDTGCRHGLEPGAVKEFHFRRNQCFPVRSDNKHLDEAESLMSSVLHKAFYTSQNGTIWFETEESRRQSRLQTGQDRARDARVHGEFWLNCRDVGSEHHPGLARNAFLEAWQSDSLRHAARHDTILSSRIIR